MSQTRYIKKHLDTAKDNGWVIYREGNPDPITEGLDEKQAEIMLQHLLQNTTETKGHVITDI